MQSIHIVPRNCDSPPSAFSNRTLNMTNALFKEGVMRDISNCKKIANLETELKLKDELIKELYQQIKELQVKK